MKTAGALELVFAGTTLATSNKRWPFVATLIAMPALAVGATKADRSSLTRAFNPASLNFAMASLAAIAIATTNGRPSGRRPLRQAPDHQPAVEELP